MKREKMSNRQQIEQRTEELLEPIIAELGFELVDVEYVKEGSDWFLRAYIDKEGGIGVDDCETVSRALEIKLDEEDLIKDPYILEVSSPGLTRPLKKEKDYIRNLEKLIEIRTFSPIDHRKEFVGTLKKFDQDTVWIEEEGNLLAINRKDIAKITQYIEW